MTVNVSNDLKRQVVRLEVGGAVIDVPGAEISNVVSRMVLATACLNVLVEYPPKAEARKQ